MIIIILSKVGQGTKLDIVQKVSETSRIKLVIYELIFHFLVSFFLLPYHCSSIFCITSSLFEPTNQHLQASSLLFIYSSPTHLFFLFFWTATTTAATMETTTEAAVKTSGSGASLGSHYFRCLQVEIIDSSLSNFNPLVISLNPLILVLNFLNFHFMFLVIFFLVKLVSNKLVIIKFF